MNCVVGSTSQVARFLPSSYDRVSSRNLHPHLVTNYQRVFLAFAEQRTFNKSLAEKDFIEVNVKLTSKIIDEIHESNKEVAIYGTTELWNKHRGPINITSAIDYNYSPYIKSKELLWETLNKKRNQGDWTNVFMLHPTNFNSTYRSQGFLFHKIFQSILNKSKIQVGNLNIHRDLIHAKYVAAQSILCSSDCLIGSGRQTNVREFIKSLYKGMGLTYEDYVEEKQQEHSPHAATSFWCETKEPYNDLVKDTLEDLKHERN